MTAKKYLILDVETVGNLEKRETPLVYDLGYQIVDKRGNVYARRSFVIYEIFCEEKALMQSAYYSAKIPQYWEQIKSGESQLVRFFNARRQLLDDMRQYNVNTVLAYNATFDRDALNNTIRWLTKSKMRWFFNFGTEINCIWHLACQVLLNRPSYFAMAKSNQWESASGNCSTNAETTYRYLTNKPDFEEEHKGLDDVGIETAIWLHCLRQHKKMDWSINRSCWRIPQKGYKAFRAY